MQSQRRLPKRNLIGTRVSAPWSDGRFYCGTVESMTEQPNGQYMYSVLFDDGYTKLYFHKDIVGTGFNTISGAYLKHGQRVYISHQGRELAGLVVKHNKASNEVLLEVECSNGEVIEVVKRLEDVRLMESRKSVRLSSVDRDESRGVSKSIDVPKTRQPRRRRHMDDEDDDELIDVDSDMQLAAVALQNLSCSPASPHFPLDLSKSPYHSWSDRAYRSSPSPPMHHYSSSAPYPGFLGSASTDEGIEVDDMLYPIEEDVKKAEDKSKSNPLIRYKCTWKGCSTIEHDCDRIEQHIRHEHLGVREDNLSDHEEEFYYEELEMSEMDVMTSNMEVMTCASPTQCCPLNLSLPRQPIGQDHDYNRKEITQQQQTKYTPPMAISGLATRPILIPGAVTIPSPPLHTPPTPTSNLAHMFPQNSPYSRQPSIPKMSPLSPTTASPKHGSTGRKRSDIKKCRKVYGMENKDLWCTQCKWKKACTRFVPENCQL